MIHHSTRTGAFVRLVAVVSFVFISACLMSLSVSPLGAQTVTGTLLGTVQDSSGGAVAKADVSARNLDTGAVRKAVADDTGNYRISSVPAGSYEISSSAAGFKTEVRSGIVVTVGADLSVNFSLTVGAISEKVEVTAEAAQVDTSSSTMGGFVNSATIRELPLNGRDWLQLALLQPGVNLNTGQTQQDAGRSQKGNGIAFSISGARATDNVYRIDGLVVNDYSNAGPGSSLRVNMGVDAIREFSVLTDNYSAEYGRGSGGIVNAITKSGTNEFHGSAYYFHRNSALDARNFFDGATVAPFRRHQFGGAVGGAIKKDKTFFFTNYEHLTEARSTSSQVTTPSANAHNGLLCANTACTSLTQSTIPAYMKPYMALYPIPNTPTTGDVGNFVFPSVRAGTENYVIGKIDHYFSPATTLTGSYSYDNTEVTLPDNFDLKVATAPARRQNVVLNLQHLFSASVVNNTRVGISRTYAGGNIDGSPKVAALTDKSLGFLPGHNMGAIVISGVSGVYSGLGSGLGASGVTIFGYTAPQAADDLSWTKGRHSIRTGFSFERINYNSLSPNYINGQWTFNSLTRFVQGLPDQFTSDIPGADASRGQRMSIIAGYINDDFRVLPNLTLNIGVRYEVGTVVKEVNGKLANLRNITDSTVTVGDPFYHNPTFKDFAPRVGFAWDPFKNGKTAVRGGFGMFDIVALPHLFISRVPRTLPFYLQGITSGALAPTSFPSNGLPLLNLNSLSASHVQFDPHRSYRAQWNLNIQRQLSKSMALTVGYVGAVGVHLAHQIQDSDQVGPALVKFNGTNYIFPVPAAGQVIQRINPNFGAFGSTEWSGHSSYHSLQANLVQRLTKGLYYQVAYTFSKSIDNGTTSGNEGGESSNTSSAPWAFDPRINRGISDFSLPHNFVANFQYDLPVPSSLKSHRVSNTIFGGWAVGGIYTRQSGGVFSVKEGGDRAFTGNSLANTGSGGTRPNFVAAPGCTPNAVTGNIDQYIMLQCFAFPAPGVLGNLGRNTLRMPTFRDLDFSVFKNQNLWGERLKAQLRLEMFNVLNNTNIQARTASMFDGSGKLISSFGTPTAPTVNTSRQIQLGLRLLF